jgi:hypothetical protein
MERNEVIEIAINKFRGGSTGDMANWIDMALDLYGDGPKDVQASPQVSDNMAWYKSAANGKVSNGLVDQPNAPQGYQGLWRQSANDPPFNDPGRLGSLSGATVLGAEDARIENEETVDDVHTRMIEGLPATIAIEPEGCKKPMQCEVIVTKNESSTPGGRQPCVGVRFQWDTGDSKEVVCDNFIFPGKVQSPESVLSEMVDRVKSVYRRRASPIVAKTPALDKTPVNAGNA